MLGCAGHITLVATVLVTVGLGVATLLSGRPGWGITVLYPVVMAAGIGVCIGSGDPGLATFVLGVLWLAATLTVVLLSAPPARPRAIRE